MGSREATSEGPPVLHIHFCSLSNNSKQQLGAPAQTWQQYSMYTWLYSRFIEIQSNLRRKKFHWTNEGSNPGILKDDFSSKTVPSIFTTIAPMLLDQSNKISWGFQHKNQQGGKVKHKLQVTSYKFKSTSYEFKFQSYKFNNPHVKSSNPQVSSSNPLVTSSDPQVTSLNPLVTS